MFFPKAAIRRQIAAMSYLHPTTTNHELIMSRASSSSPFLRAVFAERGRKRPPPLTRVDPYTTKRGVSVCPHFLASISCWRLSS